MDLYYKPYSAPCRSVIMTAKAVGIDLNKKMLDLGESENLNPEDTVPILVGDGFSLSESKAIMIYLVEIYGKSDTLYPKSPNNHAIVNQCLDFAMDTLYKSFADYYLPQMLTNASAERKLYKKMEQAFELLNIFLEGHAYAAGDSLTLADIALVAAVSTFDIVKFDFSKYVNVSKWYENAKKVTPGWDENWTGCLDYFKAQSLFQIVS